MPPYSAEKARQGKIVLRKCWQRAMFIGALVACVVLSSSSDLWREGDFCLIGTVHFLAG